MKLPLAIPSILLSLALSGCNSNPPQPREQPAARARRPQTAVPSPAAIAANTPNQRFDYYLLNLSWSPEFCFSHRDAPECAQHLTFTLHGLWPQNTDGTYPQDCSNAPGPADPSQYSASVDAAARWRNSRPAGTRRCRTFRKIGAPAAAAEDERRHRPAGRPQPART